MRRAKSYSIIDHQVLHGGYLKRLSHQALALYLFLVVVGDAEGKSFYSDLSVCDILRFSGRQLERLRAELITSGLIDYRRPYWWVRSLSAHVSEGAPNPRQTQPRSLSKASDLSSLRELIRKEGVVR